MNNQITILDRNNQSVTVDLICYFNANNKKYVFYNKNEIVQDGLIKMYVAEENTGLSNDITPDEWNNLKKIMQGIITGNPSGIEFLVYNTPHVFNEPKAIALNDANINVIKTSYKNVVQSSAVSEPVLNKDILSQSFGGNTESVVTTEPVQISAIPNIQNNFNMESTPVNLNMNPIVDSSSSFLNRESVVPGVEQTNSELVVPNIELIPNLEPIPSIEPVNTEPTQTNDEVALNINSIKPGGIDSGFKVSDQPNIFDNPMPFQITEEEINKPIMPDGNNAFNTEPIVPPFDLPNKVENVKVDNNLNNRKIELNNKKIKLLEELANIYKEENELLKSENIESNEMLEHTASNLFNNNGTLNDNEVLG